MYTQPTPYINFQLYVQGFYKVYYEINLARSKKL